MTFSTKFMECFVVRLGFALPLFLLSGLLGACALEQESPPHLPGSKTAVFMPHEKLAAAEFISENSVVEKAIWPKSKKLVPSDEKRIKSILARMSIEDKVGQLVMGEIRDISPQDLKRYKLGGILNGGGAFPENNKYATASEWVELADEFYKASIERNDDRPSIPILWGTDAVHGNNNVYGATIFPHNIGLGATRNAELIRKLGEVTAKEVTATGLYWTFAPTVAVPQNARWGRTYEGFSEDPAVVAELATAMTEGLQGKPGDGFLEGYHILATAKHFIGDCGTLNGKDQGDTRLIESELNRLHGQGYFSTLDVGMQAVMASFNSWNGKKIHGDHYLLTEVLKNKMGFDGFVVGDWNGHGQVMGCSNESCVQSINAGVDMIMVPQDWEKFYINTLEQARNGEISEERLNDAVTRILRVKMRMGMFDDQGPKGRLLAGDQNIIGHPEHRALARQAVRESMVLLKNNKQALPLKANSKVLVAGGAAEDLFNQLGGWSMTWLGTETTLSDFPGATRIVDGIQQTVEKAGGNFEFSKDGNYQTKPDVAIMLISEPPYAEGPGDRSSLMFSPNDRKHMAVMKKLRSENIPVVTVFLSGRAMWVNPELNASDAFVAAWLPGTEGLGVADTLFCSAEKIAACDFTGRLSFSWPSKYDQKPIKNSDASYAPLFPFGFGLSYSQDSQELAVLDEAIQKSNTFEQVLFNGRAVPPLVVSIQKEGSEALLANNAITQNSVKTQVFDRLLQEDAQRISFNGLGSHSWLLHGPVGLDWTGAAKKDMALAFEMNVLKASDENIFASTQCGDDCSASLNLSPVLKDKSGQGWQKLKIDLSCFDQLGADLAAITHPLVIQTSGAWSIELSNVHIAEKRVDEESISCQP